MDCSTFNSKCTLSGDCIHKAPTFDALRNSHNDTSLQKGAPNLTADQVQRFLCGRVSNFTDQKWKGRIFLPLIPVTDALIHQHGGIDKVLSSNEPTPLDICDYLGNNTSTLCLYFDPKVYPPPEKGSEYVPSKSLKNRKKGDLNFKFDCKDDKVFIALKEYIERESVESDCSVIMNGQNGHCKNSRKYVCKEAHRNRSEEKKKKNEDDNDNVDNVVEMAKRYRLTFMIKNDKRGRRENGRAAPRRTASVDTEHTCLFKIVKKWDEYGYFIELRRCTGCPMHQYHPQPIPNSTPMPGRLLTDAECETAKHIAKSTLNNGASRNYLQSTLNKHISRAKIAYIASNGDGDKDKDEMERMFDFMDKSKDISYNMCWDPYKCDDDPRRKKLPQVGASSLVSTSKNGGGEVTHAEVNDDPTMHHIASEVEKARADQDIKKEEDVFVSIAWTNNDARRIFKLNPEVVTCDITSHSNKNKYHLLTFSVKTSHDKQVIFLWVWIPNQRRYSFRWVFQHAILSLFDRIHLSRIKMIMKDGDPQQHNEIMAAIRSVMCNAITGGCGYHIVHNTWVKYVGSARSVISQKNWTKWEKIKRMIQSYVYCLMKRGGVEDEEEYEIAKQILFDFIHGPVVRGVCDDNEDFINTIVHWLENHVLVHEDMFLHHRRRGKRTLGVAHSSGHHLRILVVMQRVY